MIDDESDPGSWADALSKSPNLRVEEYGADQRNNQMTPQKITAELVDLNHHDARLIARISK